MAVVGLVEAFVVDVDDDDHGHVGEGDDGGGYVDEKMEVGKENPAFVVVGVVVVFVGGVVVVVSVVVVIVVATVVVVVVAVACAVVVYVAAVVVSVVGDVVDMIGHGEGENRK